MTTKITLLIVIAIGGAVGTLPRYGLTVVFQEFFLRSAFWRDSFWRGFPGDIFTVNLIGSLLAGICFVLMVERGLVPEVWRALVLVGFLGAFTTFSTFSIQSLSLLQDGKLAVAAAYIVGSVLFSLLGAFLGITLARHF